MLANDNRDTHLINDEALKQAARDLECEDDEERFAERLRHIAARRPAKGKPEPETPE